MLNAKANKKLVPFRGQILMSLLLECCGVIEMLKFSTKFANKYKNVNAIKLIAVCDCIFATSPKTSLEPPVCGA